VHSISKALLLLLPCLPLYVQACRRKQSSLLPPPPLTISGVFAALHSLAAQSGQGAAGRRQATVAKLLRCCRDIETKYLVRTLVQNLRVGAGWRSVLGPLAKAALLHRRMMQEAGLPLQHPTHQGADTASSSGTAAASRPADAAAAAAAFAGSSAAKVSKQQLEAAAAAAAAAYHSCPNLDIIVQVLMEEGPEALAQRVQLTCGVPVKPMLAKACTSVADSFMQLAATAAAAAAGGVRAGRRSAKHSGMAAAGTAAAAAAAAAAVVVDSDVEEADVSGEGEGAADGVEDGSGSDAAADAVGAADEAELTATDAAADAVAEAGNAASTAGVGAALPSSSSISSSKLAVLAEYKYDGQRAQIHLGADRKVGNRKLLQLLLLLAAG
jgi:DNA ligase-1